MRSDVLSNIIGCVAIVATLSEPTTVKEIRRNVFAVSDTACRKNIFPAR